MCYWNIKLDWWLVIGNMVHNYSPSHTQQPQRYLGKFTSCMTFGAHKLVCSEPFLDYLTNFTYTNKFYIMPTYVFGQKLLQWNFIQISDLSTRRSAQNFIRRFLKFLHFPAQFREYCGAIWRWKWAASSASERAIHCEKKLKERQNWPINGDTILAQSISPRTNGAQGFGAWQTSKQTYKHHLFTPTAGARSSISPKFSLVIEDVVPIIKGGNHFSIQRTDCFSYRVHGKFWVNDRRAITP